MKLLTPELEAQLRANLAARIDALSRGEREPDPEPVVRLFSPIGAATWLATEIDADGIFFGLADLGFGCPELGSFSLTEMASVSLPLGLAIERDLWFEGTFPVSVYAAAARTAGRIVLDDDLLEAEAEALRQTE